MADIQLTVPELLTLLQNRFHKHRFFTPTLEWPKVAERLAAQPLKMQALLAMEASGGEPDITAEDSASGELIFTDCAAESPLNRRSLCYDQQALDSRKTNKPQGSAMGLAQEMGIELLTEEQYRHLQTLGQFDTKTSSWIKTPQEMRGLGGALFGDRRYGRVFFYHNGADSYYSVRGFRGTLRV